MPQPRRWISRLWPILGCLWLAAVLAGDFEPVTEGRGLVFPADTGAHPAQRTEWWYITGWLTDRKGRERGFQITFFRVGTGIGGDNPSRFAPNQIILAHAAVADPEIGHLLHDQRAARAFDPLAGASNGSTHVWIDDWRLTLENGRYSSRVQGEEFALELELTSPPGAPVLNGREGFSQKTPDPRNASYYYSRPQLAVTGRLRLGARTHAVEGQAWLDHEWSSELLPETAQGWDWIGINLEDGGSLMAFRMRGLDGSTLWAGGTLRRPGQPPRILAPGEVRFEPGREWRSPRTEASYPVEWDIDIAGQRFSLRALMDDQELDGSRSTGVVYWEGAVRLMRNDREMGRGYLEMTGYGRRPEGL